MQATEATAEGHRAERRIPNFRRSVKRERLIAAGFAVFTARGFQKSRLEDVAHLLGVTRTAVYMHFASKQELLEAVTDTYCLPDQPTAGGADLEATLASELATGPAARVFGLVISDWQNVGGLGQRYLAAVRRKLALWPNVQNAEAVAKLVEHALGGAVFRTMFAPGEIKP